MSPFEGAETSVIQTVQWFRLCVEAIGALIVATGVAVSAIRVVSSIGGTPPTRFTDVRIAFARYLALALEFQLAADILSTAIAPSWEQIGKLGAIAVIRTALNFFLTREMRDEQTTETDERRVDRRAAET